MSSTPEKADTRRNQTNVLYNTTLPHVVGCKEVQS